jgi:hypothetical protein
MTINQTIAKFYPKTIDCQDGHKGEETESLYAEADDDRYSYLIVVRCSHCSLPLREREATDEDRALYE